MRQTRGSSRNFRPETRPSGYCSCEDVGAHHLPTAARTESSLTRTWAACTIEACDSRQCRGRAQFEPFEARNTSAGFCSCDGVATYHHCDEGHVFDVSQGLCTLKGVIGNIACNLLECQKRARYEPFAAQNTKSGFCSCDGSDGVSVTFHACSIGQIFAPELGMCADHVIQKRSLEAQEKVRSLSFLKRFFQKLA
ncbi:GL20456 [Drosophila persimilis]|uniref:GL20456 n=1 Tax=Drosophila persimilis TaxID=7234 RepID=B4GQX8_DROPE|nr:GL20456 [Drosophila persimilis]